MFPTRQNTQGALYVTHSLILQGAGSSTTIIDGGGVLAVSTGTQSFQNCIIAGNSAGGSGPDVFTATGVSVTDDGGNFLGTLSGSSGFAAGTLTGNPLLGPLQNNGGIVAGATGDQQVVQTEALLPGSPAIGNGVATGAPTTDERGFPRLTPPDIGAFQFQNVPLTVTVMSATPSVLVNGTDTFTITVTNTGGTALPTDNSTRTITLSAGLTTTGPLTFTLAALPAGQSQTFAVLADGQLLGLLAGSNGQEFLIDIVNPFNPFSEPAVLAALLHG